MAGRLTELNEHEAEIMRVYKEKGLLKTTEMTVVEYEEARNKGYLMDDCMNFPSLVKPRKTR
jgi:hypothetical protein